MVAQTRPLQILWCIHAGFGRMPDVGYANTETVPECAQLLQGLKTLKR